jgi:pentatricopeptide repeat protein
LSTREIDEGTDTTVPETDHAQSTTEQRRTDHQGDDEKLSSSNPVSSAIATTSTSKDAAVNERDAWSDQLRRDLLHSTRQHNLKRSLELYDIAKQNNVILTRKVISDLFFDVSYVDPIRAFSILQDYNSHPSTDFKNLTMYKRICTSVSLLDPSTYRARHMNQFIESLLDDVDDMDDDAKNQLYPNLVITLATQRRVSLGRHAGMLYEYMKENGFDFQLSWLIKVLSLSKYNRQEDLPFHDVMAEYAARGGTRVPAVILPAIHNMFPYTDVEQMTVVLRSYLQIEMNASVEAHHHHRRQNEHFVDSDGKNDNESEDDMAGYATQETDHLTQTSPSSVYSQPQGRLNDNHLKIDMSTLEMISAGAARAGNSELVMLVWDVMEHCQYIPTEAIYENTILSFAAEGRRRLRQVFSVMASMKDVGFVPSRPLIRSLCFLLRSDKRLINEALRIILNEDEDNNDVSELRLLSLESLNVILSCLAERGDTSDTLELLRMFKAYDIQPNEDSYSFAMESLGKEIHRLQLADPTNEHNFTCIQENLQLAGSLLTEMEENGLTPSADVVRNYLELLCLANEVGTATAVIDDLLGGDFRDRVSNKSIYRVAVANVDVGNFDKAEELAGKTSEFIPILHRKIKSQRERSDWLQSR